MFMLPLFALLRRTAEPVSFLPRFFPPMWKRKRQNFRAYASASASTEKGPLPAFASTSLVVTRPYSRNESMARDRDAKTAGPRPRVWTRGYMNRKDSKL